MRLGKALSEKPLARIKYSGRIWECYPHEVRTKGGGTTIKIFCRRATEARVSPFPESVWARIYTKAESASRKIHEKIKALKRVRAGIDPSSTYRNVVKAAQADGIWQATINGAYVALIDPWEGISLFVEEGDYAASFFIGKFAKSNGYLVFQPIHPPRLTGAWKGRKWILD